MLFLIEDVIKKECDVAERAIECVQDFSNRGIFDITFASDSICQSFLHNAQARRDCGTLQGLTFTPMFAPKEVTLVVHMYNPYTDPRLIGVFLQKYYATIRGGQKIKNICGIWNGKRKICCDF